MITANNVCECLDQRDRLIEKYLPLAEKMAAQKDRTTPSNISLEDLKSVAFLALVEAAHKYNGNSQTFRAYAMIRIRGEIVDYIRSMCWGTRGNYSAIVSLDQEVGNSEGFSLAETVVDHRRPEPAWGMSDTDRVDDLSEKIARSYYVDGKTQREIGEELDMSHSKVSKILDRYRVSIYKRRKNVA